jgi:hypothetical protein
VIGPGRFPGGGGFIQGGIAPAAGMSFGMGPPGHDDPEMAKLTQSEHELEQQSHDLIRKYSETEDQQVREKAKTALAEMLDKQFELQNQRRELELRRPQPAVRVVISNSRPADLARDRLRPSVADWRPAETWLHAIEQPRIDPSMPRLLSFNP